MPLMRLTKANTRSSLLLSQCFYSSTHPCLRTSQAFPHKASQKVCIRMVLCMFCLVNYQHTTTTKSLQSCLTLCNPIDGSPPGSPVHRILQARTLEWVVISFSNAWNWKVKVKSLSSVWLLATPWTAAHQVLCPWDFPGKSTGVGCHCFLRNYRHTIY